MPKQINTHRPGQRLVQMFGLKGRYQPVLDETIVPVVVVDETTLKRRASASMVAGTGAVPGEHGFINLTNPVGSLFDLIIRGLNLQQANGVFNFSLLPWSLVGATLGTFNIDFLDTALLGLPTGVVLVGTQASASMPVPHYTTLIVGGAPGSVVFGELDYQAIIRPGGEFTVWNASPNVASSGLSVIWEEAARNVTNL